VWNFPPGQYTIKAIPLNNAASCSADAGLPVTLLALPPAPGIDGKIEICPTEIYTYSAQSSLQSAEFEWFIKNGGNTSIKTGSSIIVKWGPNPPYELSLQQTDGTGPGCQSPVATLVVQPLPALQISGPASLCKESEETYTTEQFEGIDYQWRIEPNSAGAVLSGQGSAAVQVFWQTPGMASLVLQACGVETVFPVEITTPIAPQISYPDSLCPNATATVAVLGNFTEFAWKNSNGNTISTLPSPSLGSDHYSLVVTDAAGCQSSGSFFIAELPAPTTKIVATATQICSGFIKLTALQTQDGYDFQWLRNGQPIGANQPTFDATQPGTYRVQVTDERGCSFLSTPITIEDCPSSGGGGSGPPSPPGSGQQCVPTNELSFDYQPLSTCDSVRLLNYSANFFANSQYWQVADPLTGAWYGSNEASPVFLFDEPGYYLVRLWGRVADQNNPNSPIGCLIFHDEFVSMPFAAKFDVVESCVGLPTKFTDLSTFLPETSIADWAWDFGDPASGAENSSVAQHPKHVYAQAGTYTATLTITSTAGCVVSFAKSVTVHGFPSVSFDPPAANCEAAALQFMALGSNGAISYAWNFGDAGSGAGNASQNPTTWHAYPAPDVYEVTVTAANIYGCTASYSANVAIEANTLAGSITPKDPDPVCEDVQVSFTAPSGGSSWLWSNGATSSSISTSTAGVYSVTVTDSEGCVLKPESVILEVIPGPVATIRAVKRNEDGQPVAYFDQGYTTCEGEEVYLEMNGDSKYHYEWSNGTVGDELLFSEADGSLLPAGQHNFTVTVTDIETGCTSVEGPFPVTVNGAPTSVSITSFPAGPLCDGTVATFSVVNPQADYTYLWNTGANSTSMVAAAAGSYLVVATNQFGCKAKSNDIEIHNAPSAGSVPAGCYTRCNPTEICLPQLPEVVDYQWFLNGVAVPAPNGKLANPTATESGDYQVQMTSEHGCVNLSGLLSLSLEAPTGDIVGTVWVDENGNGQIDPADTPLDGVGVLLSQNGQLLGTENSANSGSFDFEGIPSEVYMVQLDTASLASNFEPIIFMVSANLAGCDAQDSVQFLVKNLCPSNLDSTIVLFGCPGDSVAFASQMVAVGETQVFVLQNFAGCDSVVTVTVNPYLVENQLIELMSCPGEPTIYNGQNLMPGDTASFVFPNQYGCDSIVTVTVGLFQAGSPTVMQEFLCPGDSLVYNGETLWPGDQRNYVFQDENGCDSLVNLTVLAYPAIAFEAFATSICPGTSDGSIELELTAGDAPLTAALDESTFTDQTVFDALPQGEYQVQVRDVHGCIASQWVEIQAFDELVLEVPNYVLPCDEPSVTLRPLVLSHHGPLHWQWQDGSTKDWFHAKEGGLYLVQITDDCTTKSQEITVHWGDDTPAEQVYVPNAFSPNGDGINDVFKAYPAQGVDFQEFEFLVFDRWGNQLFISQDPTNGWDGFYQEKLMDVGVVAWYLHAKLTICGREVEIFKEGGVTVMR
ncbi:MAG: PKD domain-containing protein, partial [Saprospiraceae bacterium]|nr:PKD domain-containing protein [Saprospiraceae bacterium]